MPGVPRDDTTIGMTWFAVVITFPTWIFLAMAILGSYAVGHVPSMSDMLLGAFVALFTSLFVLMGLGSKTT